MVRLSGRIAAVPIRRRLVSAGLGMVAALVAGAPPAARAGVATDCFPDRVAALAIGAVASPPAFNSWQPGIVLGPPGSTTPTNGTLTVLSLGHGGSVVLEFIDNEIVDGPGPDFIVFENAFFCTAPPATAADPWSVFAEPGIVEASEDGLAWHRFPYDAAALAEVTTLCSDRTLIGRLRGLFGITPNFTGNWTVADDPAAFDAASPGGVSGHGGDAFDLATVSLARARFLRLIDPDLPIGIPGSADGLDVDAVVALNALPLLPGPDTDGDRLPDDVEIALYLTDPGDPDTDGDGVPDGAEAASCRDPRSAATAPFALPDIELEVFEASPAVARWSTLGPGTTYDLVRGDVAALRSAGGLVDLGVVTCIENDSTDLSNRGLGDAVVPPAGGAFFYLVRQAPRGSGLGYGASSAHEPRQPASGDCQ